jgi:hypothetical protein
LTLLWSWYWKSSGPELLVLEARHQHPLLLGIIGAFVLFLLMHWPQSAFDTLLEPAWSFFCPELALGSSSPVHLFTWYHRRLVLFLLQERTALVCL